MAGAAGPVCFRISAEEKDLLEVLAQARGTTLSQMTREWVMDTARAIVKEEGGLEKVIEDARLREREATLERERLRAERLAKVKI